MMCPTTDARKHIDTLHAFAVECDLSDVSQVHDLVDSECSVDRFDSLEEFKVRARFMLPVGAQRVLSIEPIRIIGFTALLPNDETFFVGLAMYPEIVTLQSGEIVATGLANKAHCQGFVQTIIGGEHCSGCSKSACCVESHKIVVNLLEQALINKCSVIVLDPAMYWEIRDEARLCRAIGRAMGCAAGCC